MIIQNFDLNMIPDSEPVIVHVDQYDEGTGKLVATLYNGDSVYSTSGTAVIQGTKPDGHGFQYSATLSGSTVTANLTKQMTAAAGNVRTQFVITETNGRTGTFCFTLAVQKSGLPADTDMSTSAYQLVEQMIDAAEQSVIDAGQAAQQATINSYAAEAWAVGTRNGEQIPSTDPAYNNHAKFWAGQAEQYAQGGLMYKGSIAFASIPTSGMKVGDMYNITNDFTTDSRFEEGSGKSVKAGTNIAWNSNSKWDCMVAFAVDTTPTQNSTNLISSGGVWTAIYGALNASY